MIIRKYLLSIEESFSFLNDYGFEFHSVQNLNRIFRVYYYNGKSSELLRIEYSYANYTIVINLYSHAASKFRVGEESINDNSIDIFDIMKSNNPTFNFENYTSSMPRAIGYDNSCKKLAEELFNYFAKYRKGK